jgi:group I intron endonuclease
MVIYRVTNTQTGKIYIGQTTRPLSHRKSSHYTPAELNDGSYFHNSLIKYPKELWIWEIIDTVNTIDELNLKEQYWIGFYKSNVREFGYNLSTGGLNNIKTPEVCQRISKALTGRIFSEEHKLHIKEKRQYQICTNETRKKMSEARSGEKHPMYGKSMPDEVKQKISESLSGENHPLYGKHRSLETIEKMKLNSKHIKNPKYNYTIISPENIKYETDDLNLFCKEHNLNRTGLTMKFYQKTKPEHTYKGWQISRIKKSYITNPVTQIKGVLNEQRIAA